MENNNNNKKKKRSTTIDLGTRNIYFYILLILVLSSVEVEHENLPFELPQNCQLHVISEVTLRMRV